MDDSSKEISSNTTPNILASGNLQPPSPPKTVYLSVFDRIKNPNNVTSSPGNNSLNKVDPLKIAGAVKKSSLDKVTDHVKSSLGKMDEHVKNQLDNAAEHVKSPMAKAAEHATYPHDMTEEYSSSSICEFCLSKEEMHKLQHGREDANLSEHRPAGDTESSTSHHTMEDAAGNEVGHKKDDSINAKAPSYKIVGNLKGEDVPSMRLRDIQMKMPQKSTAVEALGKYFNVTVVSPKIEAATTKTTVSTVQKDEAKEVPRTKSEEFTPMAQEEEEVKRLIEEVRMAGEPGDHGEGRETKEGEESTVLGVEVNISEMKQVSIVSLKRSESSDLSLQSVTSSLRSLDYGPDIDDSGLEEDLEEMAKHKFVLLRRIPNTFPFAKDCLNVMDVTNRVGYDGKGGDDPQPMVSLTVKGIVPLNPDGTPLPYQGEEPEMSTEVDLHCHCCQMAVLPTMSDDEIDDDESDEMEGENEADFHSSAEEMKKAFGMQNSSVSALDAMARTVAGSHDEIA